MPVFPAWSVHCPDSTMLLPSGPAYVATGSQDVMVSNRSVPAHVTCMGMLYQPFAFAAMDGIPVTIGGALSTVIDMAWVVTSPAESVAFICI